MCVCVLQKVFLGRLSSELIIGEQDKTLSEFTADVALVYLGLKNKKMEEKKEKAPEWLRVETSVCVGHSFLIVYCGYDMYLI